MFTPSIIGFNTSFESLLQTSDMILKCYGSYLKLDKMGDKYVYNYTQVPFILDDLYDKFTRQIEHMLRHTDTYYPFSFEFDERLYLKDLEFYRRNGYTTNPST